MNSEITASNFFSLWNEIAEAQKPLLRLINILRCWVKKELPRINEPHRFIDT